MGPAPGPLLLLLLSSPSSVRRGLSVLASGDNACASRFLGVLRLLVLRGSRRGFSVTCLLVNGRLPRRVKASAIALNSSNSSSYVSIFFSICMALVLFFSTPVVRYCWNEIPLYLTIVVYYTGVFCFLSCWYTNTLIYASGWSIPVSESAYSWIISNSVICK